MDNLEQQKQILDLGKVLVNELRLEPGSDTLSKWMAHYIAEKIKSAEKMPLGQEKIETEKECFETILKLWKHRWSLPSGKWPLETFEPILKVLKSINPDNQDPFFYHSFERELSEIIKSGASDQMLKAVKTVMEIDKVARVWIGFVLQQAALAIKNNKVDILLKNAVNLNDAEDVEAIKLIFVDDPLIDMDNMNDDEPQKKYQIEKLKNRIAELEKFANLNEFILKSYKKDLEIIQQSS